MRMWRRAHPARNPARPARLETLCAQSSSLSLLALLAGLALLPASPASALSSIRVGVADQSPAMFDSPFFQQLKIKRTRYFVPADVMRDPVELAKATAFVTAARSRRRLDAHPRLHVGPARQARPDRLDDALPHRRRPARRATSARSACATSAPGTRSTTRRRRRGTASATPSRTSRACTSAVRSRCIDVRRRRPRHARPGRLGPLHPLVLRAPEPDVAPARQDRRHPQLLRRQPQPLDRHEEDHRHGPPLQPAREVLVHGDRRAGELRQVLSVLRVAPGVADEQHVHVRQPLQAPRRGARVLLQLLRHRERHGVRPRCPFDAGLVDPDGSPRPVFTVFKRRAAAFSR